jgi:ATP-dependent Lon protease
VDKTGKDARGDPAAALLEVLDPEQNNAFIDTYLTVPVDLSRIVFIATANTVADVPPPLLDRMEVVNLSGYTVEEKLGIAERHLVPKALAEHGIFQDQLNFPVSSLSVLIEGYTREAGVRQLAQKLAAICRYVAVKLVSERERAVGAEVMPVLMRPPSGGGIPQGNGGEGEEEDVEARCSASSTSASASVEYPLTLLGPGSMQALSTSMNTASGFSTPLPSPELLSSSPSSLQLPIIVSEALIEEILGPRRFRGHDATQRVASPGAAAGLVWTSAGGAVQYIECLMVGTGHHGAPGTLTLTGQLGDVLEESAKIALSWVRAHAGALQIPAGENCPAHKWDIHIHLPAGGQPKDGPSAGVTLAVALVSLFTGRCVRADTALTGELTLRGLVLPVAGVKEKVLAAKAAGMRQVILPSRNLKDVEMELTDEERMGIELTPVERLDQVLRAAFDPPLVLVADKDVMGYPESRL